jgi:Transposase, Mutator family
MTEERLVLADLLEKAGDGDFLRAVAEAVPQLLMESDVDRMIGAGRYERSGERTTWRNGCRDRTLDTRLGALQLRIPKLRQGSYFPPFLEARKSSEKALIAVIQDNPRVRSQLAFEIVCLVQRGPKNVRARMVEWPHRDAAAQGESERARAPTAQSGQWVPGRARSSSARSRESWAVYRSSPKIWADHARRLRPPRSVPRARDSGTAVRFRWPLITRTCLTITPPIRWYILTRFRLRPTKRVECPYHSGGLGSLIDASRTTVKCSLAHQVVLRLPPGTSPLHGTHRLI